MAKITNSKPVWNFGHLNLEFVPTLSRMLDEIGIWDL